MLRKLSEFKKLLRYWKTHEISSKDLVGTVRRFSCWQIAQAINPYPLIYPWVGKSQLVVEKGMTGATMNMYCGLHEFQDMAFVLHFLRESDVFADIGANVGTYTILASKVVGAKTICVEPVPETYEKLSRNIRINAIEDKVNALCCGIGEIENNSGIRFIADQDTTNRVAPPEYAGKTVSVPIKTLDSALRNQEVFLWKIDVEGFEEQVLSGGLNAIKSPNLKAIEIEGDTKAVRKTLEECGFNQFACNPWDRTIKPIDGSALSHNALWIRDREFVSERCKDSPKYNVLGYNI